MELKIIKASIDELDSIVEIESVCFPVAEAASRRSLEERLNTYKESFLLASLDHKIVGFINGSVIDNKVIRDEFYSNINFHNPDGKYQSVFGLDVLPEYRGRGIAAQLINTLIEVAGKAGREGVTLCCKKEKVSYYLKFGFINIGKSESEHGGAVWYNMLLLFGE